MSVRLAINRFLDVPSTDPDDTRRRKMLTILAAGTAGTAILELLAIGVVITVGVETIHTMTRGFGAGVGVLVGSLLVMALNRRMASGWLPSIVFLLLGTTALTLTDKPEYVVAGRSLLVFTIPIIMASVLMQPWTSFVMAGLCSGIIVAISLWLGIFPNLFAMTIFLIVALVAWLSASTVQRALTDLRLLNRELDQRVIERTRDLAESLAKNQAILEGIADGVIVFDRMGRAVVANPAMARLAGWPSYEVAGYRVDDLMGEAVTLETREAIVNLLRGETPGTNVDKFTWGNKVFSASFAPVKSDGGTLGTVAVFRDFTKEAEIDHMKSTFVSIASHELRTPLNAILGYTEMLREGIYGALTDQQRGALERVFANTGHLLSLANNLLDRAQMEAGRLALHITSFAPADLVVGVKGVMDVLAQVKGLQLISHITDDVPPTVSGDRQRLHQILVNLVGNAVKYTDEGTIRMSIYRPDADHWGLEVSDTGRGIPKEAQPALFEPFRRVDDSATREHSGAGLGLSIVKQLVTLMGGTIRLESEVDQGSTFTIVLPLVPPASATEGNGVEESA